MSSRYASATFVIIELINNLAEPLNLPSSLLTIVVIVLAGGFPLAIILSWLYDLTSEGMSKTKPTEELKEGEKTVVPNAWKIATFVSFIVIVGLLTFNIIIGTKSLKAGDIQSLVVLPFDNFTGDDQLENMVSGMHALLVGDIGRISEVRVLGKTTSNAYKDVNISANEIASELNVDAILEASVMCLGDSVCIQFRLIRTTGEEEQLWIADYKEDKSQIVNLYNQITKQIADEIMIELNPNDVMSRIFYSHLLWILKRCDEAHFHSQMAVELDPKNPLVLALSAMVDEHGRIPQALEKSKKALEIHPDHYFALLAYAEAAHLNGDYKNSFEAELKTWAGLDDEAREEMMAVFEDKGYQEAINTLLKYSEEYARTNYIGYTEMGEYYYKVGNLEKTIECWLKAYEMHDPMMPYITLSIGGFDEIKDDPRIKSIVEAMNLPFEEPN